LSAMSNTRIFLLAGLMLALGLGLFVSPFANGSPDGLERVAEDKGFIDTATDHGLSDSPVADYSVRGVDGERMSTGLSGVIGVLICFGVGLALFGLMRVRRGPNDPRATGEET
jgi:cobalt/nickel transport protein